MKKFIRIHIIAWVCVLIGVNGYGSELEVAEVSENPYGPDYGMSILPGEPLQGPYSSPKKFCRTLKKSGVGKCTKLKKQLERQLTLGKRGRILSTHIQPISLSQNSQETRADACPILIKTKTGWWSTGKNQVCKTKSQDASDFVSNEFIQFRFADELGVGVLLIERAGEKSVGLTKATDEGESLDTWTEYTTDRRYCAVGRDHKPVCTRWTATQCGGYELTIKHAKGTLEISERESAREQCTAELFSTGTFSLFKPEVMEPASFQMPKSDSQNEDEDNPLIAQKLFGPFDSLRHYCTTPPTFSDEQINEYDDISDGVGDGQKKCAMKNKGWSQKQPRGERGSMLGASLFRIKSSLAGAPIEYCKIAIKAPNGWFVSLDDYQCTGVLGPSTDAQIFTRTARWAGEGKNAVLAIIYDRLTTHQEYERINTRPVFDHEEPIPQKPSQFTTASSWLVVCGIGPSGVPSCTQEIFLGCPDSDNSKVHGLWFYDSNTLTIKELNDPYGDFLKECDQYNQVPPGEHELEFP